MRFTATITLLGAAQLAGLTAAATASALRAVHAIDVLSYAPATVVWHPSAGGGAAAAAAAASAGNASNTTSATLPAAAAGNVTACGRVAYDAVSPARTPVVRADCRALAARVRAAPGFWALDRWAPRRGRRFAPLARNGTCEFAVTRRDTPPGGGGGAATAANSSSNSSSGSDVVIIGNQDVFRILNASVNDFAAAADEPYVDAERNHGHMHCQRRHVINASIEFRIQMAGTQ